MRSPQRESRQSRILLLGRFVSLLGTILWVYGYFKNEGTPLIDWRVYSPWWVADFLPNVEAEIGMALMCAGTTISLYCALKR
jgi:hypothetical protein